MALRRQTRRDHAGVLHIHRAERADGLVHALATMLAEPLDDPMTPEIVSVPTRGIERWLTQQLSARLGVGAGSGRRGLRQRRVPVPGPAGRRRGGGRHRRRPRDRSMAAGAVGVAAARRRRRVPRRALAGRPGRPPGRRPDADQDPARRSRRFATVRHIADLYDRYGVHRPEMLRRWAAGARIDAGAGIHAGAGGRADAGVGAGAQTASHWQAELWRQLRHRIGRPSPAERLERPARAFAPTRS